MGSQKTPAPTGIKIMNPRKQATRALWFAIASLALFVVGFVFGFAALGGITLGIIAIMSAQSSNNATVAKTLGIIGIALNAGLMFFVLVAS